MSNARFSIVPQKAVRDTRVTDSQLRTLSALGMYGDKNGWCFPKQSTLGEDVGKTQQRISDDISALVKLGYVQSYPQYDSVTGARMQNKYRILFDFNEEDDVPPTGTVERILVTPTGTVEGDLVDNAPLNAPYNTASGKIAPSALPIEWQIASGREIVQTDQKYAQYQDTANLIAMTFGAKSDQARGIALAFMEERDILIPESKIKGQRKAVKEMIEMGVHADHVAEAVRELLAKNMTVTDLFSVAKTAINLANPKEDNYSGAIEGV